MNGTNVTMSKRTPCPILMIPNHIVVENQASVLSLLTVVEGTDHTQELTPDHLCRHSSYQSRISRSTGSFIMSK